MEYLLRFPAWSIKNVIDVRVFSLFFLVSTNFNRDTSRAPKTGTKNWKLRREIDKNKNSCYRADSNPTTAALTCTRMKMVRLPEVASLLVQEGIVDLSLEKISHNFSMWHATPSAQRHKLQA